VTTSPAAALLRGGLFPALGVGAVLCALELLVSGRAAVSAGVGAAIATVALCAGPALLGLTRTTSPPMVMAVAVFGYGMTVMTLGIGYGLLATVGWLAGEHVGYGLVLATVASVIGQVRAVARMRLLAFGDGPPAATPGSGPPESPQSGGEGGHGT
jgi:hypothetical protein